MYEWMPQRTNKTAEKMIFLMFGGSAALLLAATLLPDVPFRWVFQLLALGLLTAAVFLVTRYRTKRFVYRIFEDENGGLDLTVTECAVNGKRAVTVCRVGLGNILRVVDLDLSDGGASLREWKNLCRGGKKIFDYAIDLKPTRSIVIVVNEGGEELRIRLSYDDRLFQILSAS